MPKHIESAFTPDKQEIKVTPLIGSELANKEQTKFVINPRFRGQLSPDSLKDYLFLPNVNSGSTIPFQEPDSPYTRNREVGNTQKLFVLTEPDGYQRLGVVTLKAAGLKEFDQEVVDVSEFPPDSLGVILSPNEAMIDMNMSDYLDEVPGSNIGSNLGFVSVNRADFLSSLKSRGFDKYAQYLEDHEFLNDTVQNIPLVFILRFTDPERFPYIGSHYEFDSEKRAQFTEFLLRSVALFKQEYELNGQEKFLHRYNITDPTLVSHLENPQMLDRIVLAKKHLLLFTYLVISNILAVRSLNLYHDVHWKDLGNMAKLMDFAPSLNNFGTLKKYKNDLADYSIKEIIGRFSLLDLYDAVESQRVVALAKDNFQ